MSAGAMTQEQEKFHTVKEIAGILRINPRTVRKMIAEKEIEAIQVRDEYRISESALRQFLEGQKPKDEK